MAELGESSSAFDVEVAGCGGVGGDFVREALSSAC